MMIFGQFSFQIMARLAEFVKNLVNLCHQQEHFCPHQEPYFPIVNRIMGKTFPTQAPTGSSAGSLDFSRIFPRDRGAGSLECRVGTNVSTRMNASLTALVDHVRALLFCVMHLLLVGPPRTDFAREPGNRCAEKTNRGEPAPKHVGRSSGLSSGDLAAAEEHSEQQNPAVEPEELPLAAGSLRYNVCSFTGGRIRDGPSALRTARRTITYFIVAVRAGDERH
jgi:hypothetical protein